MEIKITWSTLAKQQLKDIGQYVADNFGERTANKSLERIVKKVNSLYVFPESGSFDKKILDRQLYRTTFNDSS